MKIWVVIIIVLVAALASAYIALSYVIGSV